MAGLAPPVSAAPAPKPPEVKRAAKQETPASNAPVNAAPTKAPDKPVMRKATGSAGEKLPVSQPGDPAEREATAMAAKVMRAPIPGTANGGELAPMKPKEALTPPISRAAAEGSDDAPSIDSGAVQDLGAGQPMQPEVRAFFEQRFGQDLSHVRIHNGDKADKAARSVSARAFTVGNDIAFASGEYDPSSLGGQELIAHELVHVLQGGGGAGRMVMRDGPALKGSGTSDSIEIDVPLGLPHNKARHSLHYQKLASNKKLKRPKAYDRDAVGPEQVKKWKQSMKFDTAALRKAAGVGGSTDPGTAVLFVQDTGAGKETSRLSTLAGEEALLDAIKIPTWDKAGHRLTDADRFQVDHIVELQLGGQDVIDNYELFRASNNTSVGSTIRGSISNSVIEFLKKKAGDSSVSPTFKTAYPSSSAGANKLKSEKEIVFSSIVGAGKDSKNVNTKERTGAFWTKDEIMALKHISTLLNPPDLNADGTPTSFALYSPTGELKIANLPHEGAKSGKAELSIKDTDRTIIAGLQLNSGELNYGAGGNGPSGKLLASWDLDPKIFDENSIPKDAFNIGLNGIAGKQHAASFAWPKIDLNGAIHGFSPISIKGVQVRGKRLDGDGTIKPSVPFLEGLELPAKLDGRGLRLTYTVDAKRFVEKFKIPNVQFDEAQLTLFIDETSAGAEGGASFRVPKVGEGNVFAGISTSGSFEFTGSFLFDPALFDQASVSIRYDNKGLAIAGEIGITKPDKIKGLKSAKASVMYDSQKGLDVTGTAQPDIPGVESATLRYISTPQGSSIEGEAGLGKMPGIRAGKIGLKLSEADGSWKLGASGEVSPDIPGVTSTLQVSYDDGAFLIGGKAAYERGIFKGEVEIGATNKPIDKDGNVVADGPGGKALVAYGSGKLTARLTDWLQGTVGVKIRPDGSVRISGELGIPESIEMFGRYPNPPWEKTLLSFPTLNIPIFGGGIGSFTVGIAATIGGGLTALASVGPGKLEQAKLAIEDFDPTDFGSLHVKGHARFAVPAYAGVKLGIDAGITAGLGVISVTGGLNVGAELGIQAEAAAEADLDWTPAKGLSLQATLSASAEPKLKFSVGGFVKADVSLIFMSFTLYRKDWQFASFEYGPALRVGLSVPIGYESAGNKIDFDFNKIQFQLPSLSPKDLVSGLLDSQGQQQKNQPPR